MISISSEFKELFPHLRLGLIQGTVTVEPSSNELLADIKLGIAQVPSDFETIREHPCIAASRRAYKTLGKDPSRYRLSAEALQRRLVKSRGLYQINNLVDLINLISLQSGFSIGGYDLTKIEGAVILQRGENEPYEALGRGQLNIQNLPVLSDSQGPFGSPTSDSQRTSISIETQHVLWVFFDFESAPNLEAVLDTTLVQLKKHAQGSELTLSVI